MKKIIYGTIIALALVVLVSSVAFADDTCLPSDTPELPPTETVVPSKEFTPTYPPTEQPPTETPYIPPGTLTAWPDTATPTANETATPTVTGDPVPPPEEWTPPKELPKTGGNPLAAFVALGGMFAFVFIAARIVRKSRQA